jgi:hypothetical protein
MSDTLDYRDFEQFRKQIERWPLLAIEAGRPAMEQALLYLHGKLPEYPPPPQPVDGGWMMSDAQRRWFWANLKKGNIEGWRLVDGKPVKTGSARTGNLGRKFTEAVYATDDIVIGQLGTNVPYAPWVVGPDYPGRDFDGTAKYQARIHADRWSQLEDVVEENIDNAWDEFTNTFLPEFTKLIMQQGA